MTKENKSIWDYPNVKETFEELLEKLLNESLRGAIIIGTATVEDYLTELVTDILPVQTQAYKRRLLRYPGALSSFSAKIELSFAFRIIDRNLYDSLNHLRKLRNKAAHSTDEIAVAELNDELEKVFDIGPSMSTYIRNSAKRMLIDSKLMILDTLFDKNEYSELDKRLEIQKSIQDEKILETLEKQVPHWELIYGLSILCAMVEHTKENIGNALINKSTWTQTVDNKSGD